MHDAVAPEAQPRCEPLEVERERLVGGGAPSESVDISR
jgi:hypothetical protein